MTNIINFRTAKKKVKRSKKEQKAEENRIKFGRAKSDKQVQKIEKAKSENKLDGKFLEKSNSVEKSED